MTTKPYSEALEEAAEHDTQYCDASYKYDFKMQFICGAAWSRHYTLTQDPVVLQLVEALRERKWMADATAKKVEEHYQQPWYDEIKSDAEPLETMASHYKLSPNEEKALQNYDAAIRGLE